MRVKFDDGTAKYCCDWCKRNFTEEHAGHITLSLRRRSGIAMPNVPPWMGWRFVAMFMPVRLHFCFPQPDKSSCLDQWYRATVEAALGRQASEYVR